MSPLFSAQATAESQFMASARQDAPVSVPFFGASTTRLGSGAGWSVKIAAGGVFEEIDLDTVNFRRDAAFGVFSFRYKKSPQVF